MSKMIWALIGMLALIALLVVACKQKNEIKEETKKTVTRQATEADILRVTQYYFDRQNCDSVRVLISYLKNAYPQSTVRVAADSLLALCINRETEFRCRQLESERGIRITVLETGWALDGCELRPKLNLEATNVTADRSMTKVFVSASFLNTATHEVLGSGSEIIVYGPLRPGYSVKKSIVCDAGYEPHRAPNHFPNIVADLKIEIFEERNPYVAHEFTQQVDVDPWYGERAVPCGKKPCLRPMRS